MNRFAAWVAIAVALGVPSLAGAAVISYGATLGGAHENPSNASPGNGNTTVIVDTTAHTMRVIATFSGLTAGTTASHIHCCIAPPGNAGVATTTPTFAGFPSGVTSGNYDNLLDLTAASSWNAAFITANGGTTAGAEAALLAGLAAGQAYLNIHTSAFPSGEIRGFLAPSSVNIPALSGWGTAALVVALGAIGLLAMRRRIAPA